MENKAGTSFSLELQGDRPPTPVGPPKQDRTHFDPQSNRHSLEVNPGNDSKVRSAGNVLSRPMPANPPSSPAPISNTCSRPSSPALHTHGRHKSPLSPPITPPQTPPPTQNSGPFKFSECLMESKKLSASVHGTLTQPIVYDLSDDE
ncbi:hypothetical protein ACLMJK_001324 [Lecanora helva]